MVTKYQFLICNLRLWEKNHHQSSHSISSTSSTPPNKSSIILEPIAKDLVNEDVHSDQGITKTSVDIKIYYVLMFFSCGISKIVGRPIKQDFWL